MVRERLEYIDALRGFTMILVVFAHVETFMLSIEPSSTVLSSLFISFRMPLFFFICGYLVYKGDDVRYTLDVWKNNVLKKIRIQLIPTLIFGILYTYLFSLGNVCDFISNYHKFGYWFTICLLEMFLIVYTTSWLIQSNVRRGDLKKSMTVILLVISVFLFVFKLIYDKYPPIATVSDYFCFHQVCVYFPFFSFGYIASQYKKQFSSFLDNEVVLLGIYVLFCGTFFIKYTLSPAAYESCKLFLLYRLVQDLIVGITGIIIVYNFFRKNFKCFLKDRFIGRQLQYIGGQTLDIYLLHYFFLSRLSEFKLVTSLCDNIVIELVVVFSLSVIIIWCSLLLSKIISNSSLAGYLLLGKKYL